MAQSSRTSDGPLWAAQKAIYAALRADAPLRALLAEEGIYDGAPQKAKFPYITFGGARLSMTGASEEEGVLQEMRLLIWSHKEGGGEARRILDALAKTLLSPSLQIPSHTLIAIRMESVSLEKEQNGEIWQGVATFQIHTEPPPS